MAYNYPSQSLPANQMVPGPPFPDQGSGGGGGGGGSGRGSMPLLLATVAIPGAGLEHDSAPAQYPLQQQQQHYHHHHEHQQGLLQHPHHNHHSHHNHNHSHHQDQQLQGQELFRQQQHQQQHQQHQQEYQQQPHLHHSHHQAQHLHHHYHHHEQQQHHHHHQELPEPAQHPLHPLVQHHPPGQHYQLPTQLAHNPFMSLSPVQDLPLSSRPHNSSPQQGQSFISGAAVAELHRHTDRDDIYSPGVGPASEQFSPGPDTPSSAPDDDAPDNPAPRAGPTPAEWESMKEVIADMYMTQRQPLKDVRPILRERYGFQPSARMFKRQFEKWNWSKYDSKRVRVRRELEALASTSPFETPPDPLVRSTRQSSKMRQLHQRYNHQLSASSSQQHLRQVPQTPHTPQQSSASSSRSRLSPTPSSSTDPNPNPNLGPAGMSPAGAAGPLPPPAQNEYRAVVGGSESPYGVDVGSGSGGGRRSRRGGVGEVREVTSRWQSRMGADVMGVGGWNDDIDLSLSWTEFVGGGGGGGSSSAGSCGGNSSWGSFSGCRFGSEDEEDEVSLDRRGVSLMPLPLHQLQVGFFPERWGDMEMLVKPEPSDEGWNRILLS